MKSKSHSPLRSSVVIAKLLSSEGFTDHVANEVERYWKHSSGLTDRQQRKIEQLERDLSELCANMTTGQRMVLGRFIGLQKKMSFETGLRIGLTAHAVKHDKAIDP